MLDETPMLELPGGGAERDYGLSGERNAPPAIERPRRGDSHSHSSGNACILPLMEMGGRSVSRGGAIHHARLASARSIFCHYSR
jgi:hypothetical protein